MTDRPAATTERLVQQLGFVMEIDKLKGVLRQSLLADQSRRENSAEHSWHLAMMVLVLAEYVPGPIDTTRALELALTHDLVEIDAGDTFVYDDEACRDQGEREQRAAARVFGLLPEDQQAALWEQWRELEAGQTPEAKLVRVLDRLQPILLHEATTGVVWQRHGVSKSQVLKRVTEIERHAPALWPVVCRIVDDAVASGRLKDE
jgi:putative hydrolase of HD superfamily